MKTTYSLALIAAGLLAVPSHAVFVEVDDFEDGFVTTTDVAGQNGWTKLGSGGVSPLITDPTDAGNSAVRFIGGTSGNDKKNLYKAARSGIADEAMGALFLRFYIEDTNSDHTFGLTANDPPATGQTVELATTIRIDDTTLEVHDGSNGSGSGGGFKNLATGLSGDTWYNLWVLVDNDADTFQVYIEGGAFTTQTKLDDSGDDTFNFRYGGGANALQNVVLSHNSNGNNDPILFDDIYVDTTTKSLNNPIPEPGSLALLGLGTLCMLGRSRRSA